MLLIIKNESTGNAINPIHFELSAVVVDTSIIQMKVINTAAAAGLARPIKYFLSCA